MIRKLLFIFSLVILSCKNLKKSNTETKIEVSSTSFDTIVLAEKVYKIDANFNESTCELFNDGCDCCDGQMVFINEKKFISQFYCIPDNTYCKGTYELKGDLLILKYSELTVVDGIIDENIDSTGFYIEKGKSFIDTLTAIECNNKIAFKSKNDFLAESQEVSIETALETYSSSPIWDILQMDN